MTARSVILALPADLMFASRIRATAQALGVDVDLHSRPAALLEAIRSGPPRLILVDLDARGWDASAVVREIRCDARNAGVQIVAFVSHVRDDAIQAAKDSGADRVLARSAFVRQLPDLLATAAA
ncbi:MAG: hypothetical protein ACREL7_05010 [Longimicrobiales bacterium]